MRRGASMLGLRDRQSQPIVRLRLPCERWELPADAPLRPRGCLLTPPQERRELGTPTLVSPKPPRWLSRLPGRWVYWASLRPRPKPCGFPSVSSRRAPRSGRGWPFPPCTSRSTSGARTARPSRGSRARHSAGRFAAPAGRTRNGSAGPTTPAGEETPAGEDGSYSRSAPPESGDHRAPALSSRSRRAVSHRPIACRLVMGRLSCRKIGRARYGPPRSTG